EGYGGTDIRVYQIYQIVQQVPSAKCTMQNNFTEAFGVVSSEDHPAAILTELAQATVDAKHSWPRSGAKSIATFDAETFSGRTALAYLALICVLAAWTITYNAFGLWRRTTDTTEHWSP